MSFVGRQDNGFMDLVVQYVAALSDGTMEMPMITTKQQDPCWILLHSMRLLPSSSQRPGRDCRYNLICNSKCRDEASNGFKTPNLLFTLCLLHKKGFSKLPWEVSMSAEDAARKLGSFLGLGYLAPASVINLDVDQARAHII